MAAGSWRAGAVGGGLALVVTAGAMLSGALHTPALRETVPVVCPVDVPTARAGRPLTVLVWNAQFSAGRDQQFFYDGGRGVSVPPAAVDRTLDALARVVRAHDPDLILWQELDRDSDRTGRLDQVRALLERLPAWRCHASTPYHRVPYVPTPAHEHLGRVDMHLAVFSRVRLGPATRHQLPLLDEPGWRRAFNLKRAILEVRLPVEGGADLAVLNTHLSAFSRGDGTLPRQVRRLHELATTRAREGLGVLLAGDLNALPPGEDPATVLEKDRALYGDGDELLAPLYEDLRPAVPLATYRRDPARWFTYAPFGGRPDRAIDHAFTAGPVRLTRVAVDPEPLSVSDHLPLLLTVVPGAPTP
jgi:endonuclease/exonuclease/phosphatase family metal-dependent hydrolase